MARADSTIRVNIIGDAKSLTRAADTAEGSVKGMNKTLLKAGGIIAGAFVTDALIDFGATALKESDRVGDAAGRLEKQLGGLSGPIIDAADEFSRLGASEGDMLTLEARIVDIGTAAGIADQDLAPFAQSAAELAAKAALVTDVPADEWIERIGKAAASGDARSLRNLGIFFTDAEVAARALVDTGKDLPELLTEQELATARANIVIEKLAELYGEAGEKGGDFESKTLALGAKMETLQGKVGGFLEEAGNPLLDFILRGIEGWELFADRMGDVESGVPNLFGPLQKLGDIFADMNDTIAEGIGLLLEFLRLTGQVPTGSRAGSTGSSSSGGTRQSNGTVTVNVNGGSPEVIEQSVRRALQQATGRGPLE